MILWRRVRKRLYSILILLDALVDSFDSSCIAISYHWYWTFCFDSCQWYWNWAYFLFSSALICDRGRERRCWNHDLWSQELGYCFCVCQYSQYGVEVLRLGRHLQVYWIWWWRDHALYILYTSSWYWIVPSFVYIDSIYQVVFPLIQFKFYAAIRSLASEIVACLLYTYIKINQKRGTLDVPVYCFLDRGNCCRPLPIWFRQWYRPLSLNMRMKEKKRIVKAWAVPSLLFWRYSLCGVCSWIGLFGDWWLYWWYLSQCQDSSSSRIQWWCIEFPRCCIS